LNNLTAREETILKYVVTGKTNAEIAKELFVSSHTIKAHLSSIMKKLGLQNRVTLAVYTVMHGLADEKLLPDIKNPEE